MSILRGPLPRLVFIALYLVFIVSMFAYSLIPNFSVPRRIVFLYPTEFYKPLVRDDLKEIDRLLQYIERLSADKPGASFYLLSSSALWNSSILQTAVKEKYKNPDRMPRINTTSDVDRRDGFPLQFFTSRYVIVAEPLQYHLDKKNQRIITLPSEKILGKEGIGLNYKELPESFDLDNAYVKYFPGKTVSLNLGGSGPTETDFSFNGDLKGMRITPSLGDDCGGRAGVELALSGDGREIFRRAVKSGETVSYDVDLAGVNRLKLSAMNTGPEDCDALNIKVVSQDWKTE